MEMKLVEKIKKKLQDPLATFKLFERLIAAICIAIPAILWLTDTGNGCTEIGVDDPCVYNLHPILRSSISDYVYMRHSYVFGMLLTTAAMLFIFNGAVYFRNEERLQVRKAGKWYNVILGISLLLVIVFPYKQYRIPHYFFAGIFFLGNAFVIGKYHRPKYRVISNLLAWLTAAFIAIGALKILSLLWGEWLSLAVIGVHLILEAKGDISKDSLTEH